MAQVIAALGRATRAVEAGAIEEARAALADVRALDPDNLQALELEERCKVPRTAAVLHHERRPPRLTADITQQPAWLSFERNVRERRAMRCEQVAEAAIESGAVLEADAAIDELGILLPAYPRLPELRERAAALHAGPPPEAAVASSADAASLAPADPEALPGVPAGEVPLIMPSPAVAQRAPEASRPSRRRIAGPLLILTVGSVLGLGSWWWLADRGQASAVERTIAQRMAREPAATASQSSPAQSRPPDPSSSQTANDREAATDDVRIATPDDAVSVRATELTTPPASGESRAQAPADASVSAYAEGETGAARPLPEERTIAGGTGPTHAPLADVAAAIGSAGTASVSARPPSFSPTNAVRPLDDGLSSSPRAEGSAANVPAAAAPSASAPDPTASLDAGVKKTLDRYALGYSTRQAAVVQQIWPSVDARALERAFKQLDSQQVSFDGCRIDLAASTATATCSGTASWVPAIGDRTPRRQSRTWEFVLARDGQAWIITQAKVGTQ